MKLGYMGTDQYGQHYEIKKHPRKELLEKLGYKHADKMYIDRISTGKSEHIGYVIGGLWITVCEVHDWDRKNK